MRTLTSLGLGALLCFAAAPAHAQLSAGGPNGVPTQPLPRTPDIAPPALPGAGNVPVVGSAPVSKTPAIADPTQALFAAVNKGDYNDAQDAISRGANLGGTDQFGETPLDLAVALNRSSIIFLILSTENEDGGDGGNTNAAPVTQSVSGNVLPSHKTTAKAKLVPVPVMGNDPGTPNAAAGFLGFGK